MKRNYKAYQIWIGDLRYFLKENIKAIIFISIIGFIILLFLSAPFEVISTLFKNYKCETECTTISGIAKEVISHNLDGSSVETFVYTVEFGYNVDGYYYTSEKVIHNSISNSEIITLIKKGETESLVIKFDCEKPYNSTIARK